MEESKNGEQAPDHLLRGTSDKCHALDVPAVI
jgi:hypothetical protein